MGTPIEQNISTGVIIAIIMSSSFFTVMVLIGVVILMAMKGLQEIRYRSD